MLKPLADHVIVEVVEVEEKTASGIFLPDTAVKEKPLPAWETVMVSPLFR